MAEPKDQDDRASSSVAVDVGQSPTPVAIALSALVLTPDSALEAYRARRAASSGLDVDDLKRAREIVAAVGAVVTSSDSGGRGLLERLWSSLPPTDASEPARAGGDDDEPADAFDAPLAPSGTGSSPPPERSVPSAGTTVPEPARVAVPEPARVAVPEPARVAAPEPARVAAPEPARVAARAEPSAPAMGPMPAEPPRVPPSVAPSRPNAGAPGSAPDRPSDAGAVGPSPAPSDPGGQLTAALPFRPGAPGAQTPPPSAVDAGEKADESGMTVPLGAMSPIAHLFLPFKKGASEASTDQAAASTPSEPRERAVGAAPETAGNAPSPVPAVASAAAAAPPPPAAPVPSAPAALPQHLAALSLEQYAALCAECAVYAGHVAQIHGKYGIRSDSDRALLDQSWRERVANDAELARAWQWHRSSYEQWFRKQQR